MPVLLDKRAPPPILRYPSVARAAAAATGADARRAGPGCLRRAAHGGAQPQDRKTSQEMRRSNDRTVTALAGSCLILGGMVVLAPDGLLPTMPGRRTADHLAAVRRRHHADAGGLAPEAQLTYPGGALRGHRRQLRRRSGASLLGARASSPQRGRECQEMWPFWGSVQHSDQTQAASHGYLIIMP